MAASGLRLATSMRFLPLVQRLNARIARTRALCATTVSSSSHRTNIGPLLSLVSIFFFFVTCSSLLYGQRHEDFFFLFLLNPATSNPLGSATSTSIHFPWISISSNQGTCIASAIVREIASDDTHLSVAPRGNERL